MSLKKIVADSIKKADTNFFFENYENQAENVLKTIANEGFVIMPKELSEKMIKSATEVISYGNTVPRELIKSIYAALIKSY
ncbi:MAG: hypothetical protein ACK4OM_02675 [Alphaproteobacteria bacterium]